MRSVFEDSSGHASFFSTDPDVFDTSRTSNRRSRATRRAAVVFSSFPFVHTNLQKKQIGALPAKIPSFSCRFKDSCPDRFSHVFVTNQKVDHLEHAEPIQIC